MPEVEAKGFDFGDFQMQAKELLENKKTWIWVVQDGIKIETAVLGTIHNTEDDESCPIISISKDRCLFANDKPIHLYIACKKEGVGKFGTYNAKKINYKMNGQYVCWDTDCSIHSDARHPYAIGDYEADIAEDKKKEYISYYNQAEITDGTDIMCVDLLVTPKFSVPHAGFECTVDPDYVEYTFKINVDSDNEDHIANLDFELNFYVGEGEETKISGIPSQESYVGMANYAEKYCGKHEMYLEIASEDGAFVGKYYADHGQTFPVILQKKADEPGIDTTNNQLSFFIYWEREHLTQSTSNTHGVFVKEINIDGYNIIENIVESDYNSMSGVAFGTGHSKTGFLSIDYVLDAGVGRNAISSMFTLNVNGNHVKDWRNIKLEIVLHTQMMDSSVQGDITITVGFSTDNPDDEKREDSPFVDVITNMNFYNPDSTDAPTSSSEYYKKASVLLTIVTNVAIILSVVMSAVLGVKYMLGSVEERADYKKTLLPYLVGAFLVFGISTVIKILQGIGETISNI